jgi:hypothetical protein
VVSGDRPRRGGQSEDEKAVGKEQVELSTLLDRTGRTGEAARAQYNSEVIRTTDRSLMQLGPVRAGSCAGRSERAAARVPSEATPKPEPGSVVTIRGTGDAFRGEPTARVVSPCDRCRDEDSEKRG